MQLMLSTLKVLKRMNKALKMVPGVKLRDAEKMAFIPIKVLPTEKTEMLSKPKWLKIRLPKSTERIDAIKQAMRKHGLHSVCEEASCPNLSECFNRGTATFMILGAICTRRCPFCDVAHGRPLQPDAAEPEKLALTIKDMKLNYVVITSVDRDDLRDGGAQHFADCIREIRKHSPHITIEVLVPDFRGRMDRALEILIKTPPDVFNHNLETAPRLYQLARPGANYKWSLELLRRFKEAHPEVKTKSGLMLGLGEEISEIEEVLRDLREHNVDMLTVGQYLQPSKHHLPVKRYVPPIEFDKLKVYADKIGFAYTASGPLVRSSYHADQQAAGKEVK
jgi:lipoic acid synthetase